MKFVLNGRTVVALALTVNMAMPLAAFAVNFTDVQGSWAQTSIQKLSDQKILGGYPDGTFRPQGQITRAEFAAMMVKALGLNTATVVSSPSFNDVPNTHWAFPSVEAVRANGLVSGYPGGLYMPAKNISRAEAMAMLVHAGRIPVPSPAEADQILMSYGDTAQIPGWAKPAVAAAIQTGIFATDGSQNMIRSLDPATRADVAVMTDRLWTRMAQQNNPANTTNVGGMATVPPINTTGNTMSSTLQGRVSMIPADTRFNGTLSTAISSEINRVGDEVRLTIDRALVTADNQVIVPLGSQIVGRISQVEAATHTGKNAMLDIAFTEIQTPDGRRIPIEAAIATEDGMLQGGTNKGRILKALGTTAVGAGLGAALGTAMGPLSGGKVGKGAIYGTAVGAGLGAVAAVAQKGKEVVVTTGDQLEIRLVKPITLEAGQ